MMPSLQFSKQHWKSLKFPAFFTLIAIAILMLVPGAASAQADTGTAIRFLHVVPGLEQIDVYVNDSLVVSGLDYGEETPYLQVPEGNHTVRVTLEGLSSVLWEQPLAVPEGEHLTLIASSTDPLNFTTFRDDLTPLAPGTSRIIVVHAISGGPDVDFMVEGDVIVSDLGYGNFINSIDVPANSYQMAVVPAGGSVDDAIFPATSVSLVSSTTQIMVLYGTPGGASALVLTTATAAGADDGFVRVIHGAVDAPAVDVLLNDIQVIADLAYGDATEHLALPAGGYTVAIQDSDSGDTLAEGELTVSAGEAQTVFALAGDDGVSVTPVADDLSAVNATTASISIANLGSDPASVSFDDAVLVEDLASGEVSETLNFEPLIGTLSVNDEGFPTTIYGGIYYQLLVLDDGSVALLPTELSYSLESLPGGPDAVVAATPQPEEPGQVTEETAIPDEVTTEEVVTTEEAVATAEVTPEAPAETEEAATEVPVEATAAPTIPAATPTATPIGPTARVLLNPGANLQLRQFPSSQAFSLGRAPADSLLIVLGREGAPLGDQTEDINATPEVGAEPTPEATEYVDPVSLLAEDEDLLPEETWLFVIYQTPDGGEIEAWVNSLYVQIRDTRGFLMRLRDLPVIPGDRSGESRDTSILPPTVQRQFVQGIVTQLNQGANLNIRRTADENSEVLAQLAGGEQVAVIGVGASGEWAFVRYAAPEGGEITGWVDLAFLRFEYNGQVITPGDAQARDLLDEVDEAVDRGAVAAGTGAVATQPSTSVQPTPLALRNVVIATVGELNPGIRLNLRRTPSTAGEVIGNIEPGTQLVVLSQDLTGEWLQAEFDGQLGWVSTQYVFLTFNGAAATLDQVPVDDNLIAEASGVPSATMTIVVTVETTATDVAGDVTATPAP